MATSSALIRAKVQLYRAAFRAGRSITTSATPRAITDGMKVHPNYFKTKELQKEFQIDNGMPVRRSLDAFDST